MMDLALADAKRLKAEGRPAAAVQRLELALAEQPGEPRALNMLGAIRLAAKDFTGAERDFAAAAAADPAPPIFLNLAFARNGLGDVSGEREALDCALEADPYFQLALFHKGRWLLRHEGAAAGATAYGRFLATIPPNAELSPGLAAAVAEAEPIVRKDAQRLGRLLDEAFDKQPSARIAAAIDVVSGRSRVYRSEPANFYVPQLPEPPFFASDLFPWLTEFEAATEIVQRELATVIAEDAGLTPYIAFDRTVPVNQWRDLNHSRAWSALHLWRHGVNDRDNQDRCPETSALMKRLPLFDLAGRGPNVMFSILAPGSHIPPHTGSSNARATIHLPLVVPSDCALRVGGEIREWRVGTAFAFDDTIEHEAWNRSQAPRAVLIVDGWNPYLTEADRAGVRIVTTALDRHVGRTEWSV